MICRSIKNEKAVKLAIGGFIVCALIIVAVILSGCTNVMNTSGKSGNSKTFKTPEQAIEHFFEGIKENDMEKALQACSIYEYGEQYDFNASIERYTMISPTSYAPTDYDLYADYNIIKRKNMWANRILSICYALSDDNEIAKQINEGLSVKIESDNDIEQFVEDVNPDNMKDLEIIRVDVCCPDLQAGDIVERNVKMLNKIISADERKEYSVLFSCDGETYATAVTLCKFDNCWKLEDPAFYTGWNANLIPEQMSEDDYLERFEL